MPRYALVIIDLQTAFFQIPELEAQAAPLVARLNRLAAAALEHGVPVWNVRTAHAADRSTWTLKMLEAGEDYLLAGSPEAATVVGLELPPGHHELVKTRDSAFTGTMFETTLRAAGVDSLVLAGVTTHSCVGLTAADAYAHDFHVTIAGDAVASNRPDLAAMMLETLQTEYHQRVLSTTDILGLIAPDGRSAPK